MDEIEEASGLKGIAFLLNESPQDFLELLIGLKGTAILVSNKDYIEPEYGLKGVSIQFTPRLFPHKIER